MIQFPAQTAGIKDALEGAGLRVDRVDVSDYSAEHFGNLLASVATDLGPITIIYDRQFEILEHEGLDSSIQQRIIRFLEEHRRSSDW